MKARSFKMIQWLLVLACIVCVQQLNAQQQPAEIKAISYITTAKEILLRWAPTTPTAWKKSNQYGYRLTRYTVMRNGQLLAQPEEKVLLSNSKPAPLEQWEQMAQNNDAAAIVAQAIYGETFEMSNNASNDFSKIMNQTEEQQQRFGFALYAMDQDFDVALKAGLGYADKTALAGEKYLYRIVSAVPAKEYKIDSGGVFVGLNDFTPLPPPRQLSATALDKSVLLTWNYELLRFQYNSYFLERSEDGKNFKPVSSLPITSINDKDGKAAPVITYIDSTNAAGQTYYYRIQGRNAFGIKGPYSDTVDVKAFEALAYIPAITDHKITDEYSVQVDWEIADTAMSKIKSFSLNIAPSIKEAYQIVVKDIDPAKRSVIYKSKTPLESSYYFTVSAYPKDGRQPTTSLPILVQGIDSIPPATPKGLKGYIDSFGVAHINWSKNTEADMFGYRIYKATKADEEYSEITTEILPANTFQDSVQLKSLNSKVYYKVVAVDKRYNNSAYSDSLVLKKPDVVPPAPAIFSGYNVSQDKITIEWVPSNSDDVDYYVLNRSESSDTSKFIEVAKVKATEAIQPFVDTRVQAGQTYSYYIVTYDQSGLNSRTEQRLAITATSNVSKIKPKVSGLDVFKDEQKRTMDIFWVYNEPDVVEYLVYRAENDAPLTLWTTLKGNVKTLKDIKVRPGAKYQYAVQAQFANGAQSKLAIIKVNF